MVDEDDLLVGKCSCEPLTDPDRAAGYQECFGNIGEALQNEILARMEQGL